MDLIDTILAEHPTFHRGETEINRIFNHSESFLTKIEIEKLSSKKLTCYGIAADVAYFIRDSINSYSRTAETGVGISTLIFALKNSIHTAITPNQEEVKLIRRYADTKKIGLDHIKFVIKSSDQYLPNSELHNLDMVFIDGKHAFPWPVIDWFYTADKLKQGGIMLVDDAYMNSVKIIVDFMSADPRWTITKQFKNRTFAFRKESTSVHTVAWHMQPYNFGITSHRKRLISWITARLKNNYLNIIISVCYLFVIT